MERSTADLMDELDDRLATCDVQFRQFGRRVRFGGRVRTVRCHEDNVVMRDLLATDGAGQVLVVDGGGSMHAALMGDSVARSAAAHGWSGIIVYGCVRDSAALADIHLGIKALGTCPRRSAKRGAGEADVPVTFGGVTFHPGAELTSDEDGLVVTTPAD